MIINCKTAGCSGHVDYQPQVVPLSLFEKALTGEDKLMAEPLGNEAFSKAVANIVKDRSNRFNVLKTVYLTCDNVQTPHTNAYQVPST